MTNPTIRLGSTGDAVKQWQKIVGVTISGTFDSATEKATKSYQLSHSLVADGIVGPLTWATISKSLIQASVFNWITGLPLWAKVASITVIIGSLVIGNADKLNIKLPKGLR